MLLPGIIYLLAYKICDIYVTFQETIHDTYEIAKDVYINEYSSFGNDKVIYGSENRKQISF